MPPRSPGRWAAPGATFVEGFGKRELWLHLGWQDIKQRYRRSVLGPFWITIATGATAVAMGRLYSKLFKLELAEHLPYVTLGLIIWNLINASILEGADVFVANEGLIKQLPTPLSVHVYRLVWRQIILFGAQHRSSSWSSRSSTRSRGSGPISR